jgi:nitrous oxide reductase accessory protein NosL
MIKGNIDSKPIDITPYHYQDSQCGMVIDTIKYASEVISNNGKTWFFHDHGGMIKWLEAREFKDSATIWVHSIDTNRWIDAKKAYYTRDENTPMHYGFGAYESKKNDTIPYAKMRLLTLRGETMANPIIRKQLIKSRKEKYGNH